MAFLLAMRIFVCTFLCLCVCSISLLTASGNTCERPDLLQPVSATPPPSTVGDIKWAVVCLIRHKDTQNNARNKALATYLSKYADQHNFTILMFSEDTFTAAEIETWSTQFSTVGPVQLIDTSKNAYWFDGARRYGYK